MLDFAKTAVGGSWWCTNSGSKTHFCRTKHLVDACKIEGGGLFLAKSSIGLAKTGPREGGLGRSLGWKKKIA